MPKDPPGYRPYTWGEEQDYMELPQGMRESDAAYSVRKSTASLSAAIIKSLQSVVHRYEY